LKIVAVSPDQVADWWPYARDGLDNMLDNHSLGIWTEQDFIERLQSGEWQLFIVFEGEQLLASLVCTIAQGRDKVFEVGFCWGEAAQAWTEQVYNSFAVIGRELGCDKMTLNGRPGWARMAKKLGFEVNSVTFARNI
jgi:hypothetical protein